MRLFDGPDLGPPIRRFPDWYKGDSLALMDRCIHAMPWQQRQIHGIPLPRLESLHGPAGFVYTYSGNRYQAEPMAGTFLEEIATEIRRTTGYTFDVCFANHYRTGKDSIGWHSDDEPSLGPAHETVIASLSLGHSAWFEMRRIGGKEVHRVCLASGDLLLMREGSQSQWQHRVPKSRAGRPRVCLTFRRARHVTEAYTSRI